MTRIRRRGLTCHRSVRRGRGGPRAEAIRLVPAAPPAAAARAVPAAPGFPSALAVLVAWVALAAWAAVPVAQAELVPVLRVLAAASAVLTAMAAQAAMAAMAAMAGRARSIPSALGRAEARRTGRIPRVSPVGVGSPIRFRTNRYRSGPRGMNRRRTATRMCRRLSRASSGVQAAARCGPRRAGGGGGSSWRAAAWWSWSRSCSRSCC